MILSGTFIRDYVRNGRLLKNAVQERVQVAQDDVTKIMSYGVGFAGYDIRLGNNFLVFGYPAIIDTKLTPLDAPLVYVENGDEFFDRNCIGIDPKQLYDNPSSGVFWKKFTMDAPFYLCGNTFVLGESVETFDMEPNVIGICFGKSTYARAGVLINVTPIEPGWKGRLVIEIANLGRHPVKIYPGEGIAQVLFAHISGDVARYNGKWQEQKSIEDVASHCQEIKVV